MKSARGRLLLIGLGLFFITQMIPVSGLVVRLIKLQLLGRVGLTAVVRLRTFDRELLVVGARQLRMSRFAEKNCDSL